MVKKITKPWLFLPPKFAHDISPYLLKIRGSIWPKKKYNWKKLNWRDLEFCNPLGIAGGVDKNAEQFNSWWTFGPGFVEIGTVTPRPQEPNPGTIVDRDFKNLALWNKMGFPNKGLNQAFVNLNSFKKPHYTPLFVNIGKNRDTPNDQAAGDYIQCMKKLSPLADVFVINISSPNTKNLRELLSRENLQAFLQEVLSSNVDNVPVLLKLSPDLEKSNFLEVIDTSYEQNIDGWIFTNTTLARSPELSFPDSGGVSGRPLAKLSKEYLQLAVQHLGQRRAGKLIVSCGGVLDAEDVFDRLAMGADLVQVYTALIFNGPHFFRNVADKASAFK